MAIVKHRKNIGKILQSQENYCTHNVAFSHEHKMQ